MAKVRVLQRNEQGELVELDTEPQIMNEEIAGLIGRQDDPVILEVERGAVRRYAQATEDPNPLYYDLEYARNSKYGGIISPPGFFGWPVKPVNITEMEEVLSELK
ncbi:MaoC family dehydratase N-terminal domain-containing protein [Chloroflexota bacterium]